LPLLFFGPGSGCCEKSVLYFFLGPEPMSSVANTQPLNTLVDHTISARLAKKKTRHIRERVIEGVLFLAASVSVAITVGIVVILVTESYQFFQHISLVDFLTDNQWTPLFDDAHYGIMVLLSGTVVSSFVALAVAIPLGTMIAIYLSEFAPFAVREIAKPFLELLGGVPTIVYGYFALLYVTPALQFFFPGLPGFNLLSAGLVMGIMIIPYVSSVSEDAMRSVPMAMREGSYAMGATRFQTAVRVVTPAAFSGIAAAYILGVSRAVGETMIVAVAAGMQPNLTWNPAEPAATITAYIVQVALGDLPHGSIGYQTIFAAGLTLMLLTLFFNVVGHFMKRRYRQVY
jgi:phosphate transport system permease protein